MKTILAIDDDEKILRLLCALLKSKGYEVVTASGPAEGLEAANQKIPNLIILDIFMEPVDGFCVLMDLKNTPATKNIPVLMLTTAATINEIDRAFQLGASDYLLKPVNSFYLYQKVHRLLPLPEQIG